MMSSRTFVVISSLLVSPAIGFSPNVAFYKASMASRIGSGVVGPLNLFDKMFQEEGTLGKGITVGKVQVALTARDRSKDSIFGLLEESARSGGDSNYELASMANKICLALIRKSDEWVGACSSSQWFGQDDGGKAESLFNQWSNAEAAKFEKEYIPGAGADVVGGGATTVVVSLIVEILGDSTKFEGAGYSLTGTKEVLSSIAADVLVEEGDNVNAVEAFWTPSERDEVLTSRDIIVDFPELITI